MYVSQKSCKVDLDDTIIIPGLRMRGTTVQKDEATLWGVTQPASCESQPNIKVTTYTAS